MSKRITLIFAVLVVCAFSVWAQRDIPDLSDTKVSIPWTELKKLIEAGMKPDTLPAKPPRDFIVSSSSYSGLMTKNALTLNASLSINILTKDWVTIPLLPSNVAIREALFDGNKTNLTRDYGQYQLIVRGQGWHDLKLSYVVKTASSLRGQRVDFPIARTPISLLTLQMPKTNLVASVEPSSFTETSVRGNITVVTAVLPECDRVSVEWTKPTPEEKRAPAILYADISTLISIGEGILSGSTTINYSILQSAVSSFRLSIPKDVRLLDLQGGEFKVIEEDNQQIVSISTESEVKGSYWLSLSYEKVLEGTSATLEIPEIKVLEVEREKGFIGIEARTNVEIKTSGISGSIEQADVKELPQSVWGMTTNPVLLGYKYLKHPYSVSIEVIKHEGLPVLVATIDQASFTTLFTEDGKSITRAVYHIRNNLQQFVTIDLPESSQVWSSFVSGRPVKPTKGDKENKILVQLERSKPGEGDMRPFPVEVVYLTKGIKFEKSGELKAFLPKADIPASELYWSVWLPEDYKYKDFGGNVKEAKEPVEEAYLKGGRAEEVAEASQRQMLPSNVQVQMEKEFRQIAVQAGKAQGVFPVAIRIPEKGKFYRFSKLLVTDELPNLTAKYKKK
ncbi:MAG: hypothetical protein AB1393_03630 [Candidatus Edwardsbacteria bacterium]